MKSTITNWNDIINDFKTSELTMKEYCVEHNYAYHVLGYHRRKWEKDNNFSGFIEVKDEANKKVDGTNDKAIVDDKQTLDNGFIEIKIKEITIKVANKKIINLVKEMFLS